MSDYCLQQRLQQLSLRPPDAIGMCSILSSWWNVLLTKRWLNSLMNTFVKFSVSKSKDWRLFRSNATEPIANSVPTMIPIAFFPSVEVPVPKRQLSFYLFTTTLLIYSTDALVMGTPNSIVSSSFCFWTIDSCSPIYKPPMSRGCALLAKGRPLPKFLQLPTLRECRQSHHSPSRKPI